ncbi:HAMP domain-containing protein [Ktedonosporobacter rubrisoli]|uniref:HAMP domain-containing protein n=1 Tax=Ktedonosporobacter rubrisoli TaxID=2509675 RepID=A0A4P6K2L6_KTERU|nr:methyl-accepting chemotaxis protein [Ktedonosporobacter rubrisoli]QBD82389.1 HAMP domain-containing protein [Ktedonosporobacter rubrisoli]
MNPDRNKSGMTVDALMQIGLIASTAIPVLSFALLGFASLRLQAATLVLVIVAFAIIVLLGVLIVNYFVQRRIKDRILGLVDVCREYAGGDHTVRAVVNGDDDFAMLSMSLNSLLDNQGSSTNASLGAGGSDAAALQAQIEKLLQEVSAVGDGDLRVQAEVTPDTLGVLADSFNYMIEELAKVVGRVQSTAVQVTNATRRILDRSAELAQASEAQVTEISQTTEAVEALAVFIQNVARNAQSSAEAAQEALRNATSGQQSVRQTIDGMMLIRENVQETSKKIKRLGERSNEIGEIVRIIEDIADQTNLLALNAAIQSAMAGEHGRGFAVVADEIRLLAERSTESTKRIATLIKSIQGDTYEAVVAMEDSTQEVVKGSQLADEAGRSLNSIYSAVERQAKMIEGIARAANEQTSVSEAVAIAMGRISEITRQTDAGTQEAAVSVSYLAELSEQLRASVSTFRLPERSGEGLGSFPNMASITELPNNGGPQGLLQPPLGSGMENEWEQNFSGNFPPLPEPGNTGSLVALSSRPGQNSLNNFQDFNHPASLGGQQSLGGQPISNGQQSFASQPGFGAQQAFGNPPSLGGAQQSPFGNQIEFAERGSFENPQSFGNNAFGGGQQQFGSLPGFSGQNQFFPNNMPGAQTANPNAGLLPQPQQGQQLPPRWPSNQQQQQGQPPFNQDQMPFQNNG